MSTYSDAWRATPPAVRDFYRNHARKYLLPCQPHFETIGYQFYLRRGLDLAIVNWEYQILDVGSFNPAIAIILDYSTWEDLEYSLPLDAIPLWTTFNAYATVPEFGTDYPRLKHNVRRSKWTGSPRRRQNL